MDLPGAAPSAPQRTAAAPERGARTAAPAAPDRTNRSDAPRMRGVPLASLASCVRDSDEDQLKRRVISRVSSPGECVSPAGRYRFVETKNLNAFLMWVERASHRREGDRCTELALALECLDERRVRGS